MKAVIRDHIEQLDVSRGGGIVSEKIRVDTIDNPMLVIGLGGTGIDALLRLKYQINRRFKLPEDPITKKKQEKPENIEFLAFETNESDRHKKYNGIGLDPITEFVLLSNTEIGGLLQNRTTLEPYISDWLSPELMITDGINGASGVRQAGRLLLFTKIIQVVQTIEKKINTLSVGTSKKLVVFILTGLSGGTGSGCFLDISYIVRGLLERDHGTSGVDRVSILGYLFAPDVNLSNKSLSDHSKEYIKKNGYAALKELDYWMNVDERGERFKQKYGNILSVNSPMPPYNLAHLISATNLEGKLLENAYDYCMNVTAENITNFMASEDKVSGEEFAIHDYISNIDTNIKVMAKPYAANYKYNILGASSAVLPIEEMTTFLAFRLFQKMEKMFESLPNQEDVEKLVRKLGIDLDSVHKEFEKRVPEALPGFQNSERLNFHNVIKQQIVSIDTELEQNYLSRAREEYIKCRKQYPGQVLERFTENLNRLFLSPHEGPFYASRMIYSINGYCLLKQIESYIETLNESIYKISQDIESAKDVANQRLGDARSALISKDKKKNAFIESKIQIYHLHADQDRMEQMIDFYHEVHKQISDLNSRSYQVFTEILNALNNIFEKNGNILVNGDEQVDHNGNKTYYWNVVSVPDIVNVVKNALDERSVDELIRGFTSELLDRSHQWVREQEVDIIDSISDFLTEQFGDLITKSMEDFLVIKYGQEETIEKVIEGLIAPRLNADALEVFHLNNSAGNFHFPSWGFVSVPSNAPNIYKGIKNFQDHGITQSKFTIKRSAVQNRIFWLNTKNGIPLFLYTPIKVYEESYERTILEPEGIGRHLVQTAKINWTNLPSPIPEKSWGDIYQNNRVKAYNEEIRNLFERALKYGSIREKSAEVNAINRYECIITEPLDLDGVMNRYQLQLDLFKPNLGELKRCTEAIQLLVQGGRVQTQVRDIFGSTNQINAIENFIRMPSLITAIQDEVKKHERLTSKVSELQTLLSKYQEEEKLIEFFIETFYTGTIVKKGAQFVYDHDTDEESWEPIVNLMKWNRFVEFHLYEQIGKLSDKNRAILRKKTGLRSAQMASVTDSTPLVESLKLLEASAAVEKSKLDYERSEMVNGEEMYSFYMQVTNKVNDMLKTLR